MWRELRDSSGVALALQSLAQVLVDLGDLFEAPRLLPEALGIARELNDRLRLAGMLEGLGRIAQKKPRQAAPSARLLASAEALREAIEAPLPPENRVAHDKFVALVREELGHDMSDSVWAEARRRSLDEALADAATAPEK